MRRQRRNLLFLWLLGSASILAGCTVSVLGSLGGLWTTVLLFLSIGVVSSASTGCRVGPCLSLIGPEFEMDMLDSDLGADLDSSDMDLEDADLDDGTHDMAPDVSDMAEDLDPDADMALRPGNERQRILAKLQNELPADVVQRLRSS